ncbi:MAG: hypothetical protein MI750_05815 [Xanthomonadales bacterium]|jgi:hypothetical protein|nr:hypothetical protein [Xanthomonadales bacterium]
MDAFAQNQTKQHALASVNGSYHRHNNQDPFLAAWLADFETLESKDSQLRSKQEVSH